MILFYPNLGVPLHIGHLLTYALGWFTARSEGEEIAVMPDVNPFAPATYMADLPLRDLERLWQWTLRDFALVGLPPDRAFGMRFITQHHPDHVVATGATRMVRGMDLHPLVVSGNLQYGDIETLFGPLITIEPHVKLSSSVHKQMWPIPWAVEAVGGGLRLTTLLWQLLQRRWHAPKSLEAMVQEFDPARVSLEPIDFHCLPWPFLDRYAGYHRGPLFRSFRQNIQVYLESSSG